MARLKLSAWYRAEQTRHETALGKPMRTEKQRAALYKEDLGGLAYERQLRLKQQKDKMKLVPRVSRAIRDLFR